MLCACLFKFLGKNVALNMEAESTQSTETYLKVIAWLHANQKMLVIGAGVAAAIGLVMGFMAWQKSEAESDANAQLMSVPLATVRNGQLMPTKASPFLKLASQYPNTSSGEYAALLGAESLFLNGKYPEAHEEFNKFIDTYPESLLLSQAKIGIAACLEGEGKTSEAAQKYLEVISAYPTDANIVLPAKLTLARLDEQLNKPDQAFTFYSELARNSSPYDPWASEARERGELLLISHPELRKNLSNATGGPPGASQPAGHGFVPPPQGGTVPVPSPKP